MTYPPPAAFLAGAPAEPLTWPQHARANFRIAYPVVISQLGHISVAVADSLLVGQLGKLPLAGVALASSVFVVVLVVGLGISMGLTPLVAQAAGQGKTHRLSLLLGSGLAVCAVAGVGLAALGWASTWALPHLNQPPEVVALAAPFLRLLALSMIPLMVFQALRQFAEGLALTRQAMVISLGANLLNIALNYALIYGVGGVVPALGMIGSAWATLLARVVMAVWMAAWFWRAARFAPYRDRLTTRLKHARRILALGLPIAGQMVLETGAFVFSALMMGWIGVTAQAAHQIAINVASVTYMAASGVGAAATVRVGQFAGAGQGHEVRRAGYSALALAFGFMLLMGLLLIVFRQELPLLYIADAAAADVRTLAAQLLIVAALFQVSDGVQVAALGVLRGLEDVRVPGLISLVAYWVIALPLGYILAFTAGWGAIGLWTGLLVGLSLSALLLTWRFHRESRSLLR